MFNKSLRASAKQTSFRDRYVTSAGLEELGNYYKERSAGLEAAEKLASNLDAMATEAYNAAIKKYPYLNNAGEANSTDTFKSKCARDIKHYLRLVQYSLVVGGTGPLDEWAIAGQREVYRALGLPTAPYVEALCFCRDCYTSPRDMSAPALHEYRELFDYTINSLS